MSSKGPVMKESPFWNERIETMPPDQMKELQWSRLKRQLRYNYEKSIYYREKKFEKAGIAPEDIRSFEDFKAISIMTKDEHRKVQEASIERFGHPYGLITCAPLDKIVRINSTSGTTGTPTLYTLTQSDVKVLNEMHARKYWRAGLRPGHIVFQALSLSMFTGGLPLSDGLQAMGLGVVPIGVEGGTRRILEFARLTRPDVMIATPSFGEYLIESCPKILGMEIRDLGIRWFFCAGEPGGGIPTVRKRLEEGFGAKVFDHTGGGHAFHGISCPDGQYRGMHFVSEDHCILEVIDPKTKEPLEIADRVTGEMVFTFIGWEGGPFMRYALGDIIQIFTSQCPCGWSGMRFHILGRSDDMLIVKGVNIYPAALKDAVGSFYPRTTGAIRIILDRPGPLVIPPLKIRVEHGPGIVDAGQREALAAEVSDYVSKNLRVRPRIMLVPPGTLGRDGKKAPLIEVKGG